VKLWRHTLLSALSLSFALLAFFAQGAAAASVESPPSVVGNWTIHVDYTTGPAKGIMHTWLLTFSRNGTFTNDNVGGGGSWSQHGSKVVFAYSGLCGASNVGYWHQRLSEWKGTVSSNCTTPDSTGVWRMAKKK
jgi:hypothetical protein